MVYEPFVPWTVAGDASIPCKDIEALLANALCDLKSNVREKSDDVKDEKYKVAIHCRQ